MPRVRLGTPRVAMAAGTTKRTWFGGDWELKPASSDREAYESCPDGLLLGTQLSRVFTTDTNH
jgi:hypothetical protein